MSETPAHELYSLLIPLAQERLIVPRACVAEVVTWQAPEKMEARRLVSRHDSLERPAGAGDFVRSRLRADTAAARHSHAHRDLRRARAIRSPVATSA